MEITDFYKDLESGQNQFKDKNFSSKLFLISNDKIKNSSLQFIDCSFEEIEICNINNPELKIEFHKCRFKVEIDIHNLNIKKLQFQNIFEIGQFDLRNSTFEQLFIQGNGEIINSEMNIDDLIITHFFSFIDLNIAGELLLSINYHKSETSNSLRSNIKNCFFNKATIYGFYGANADFSHLKTEICHFMHCNFQKVTFDNSRFGKTTIFYHCKFFSDTSFKSISNSDLLIYESCIFENFSHFNDSNIKHLKIDYSRFDKKASFDKLQVEKLNLYQTIFHEGAFFDEMKIHKISKSDYIKNLTKEEANKWRHTLRQVKQELQKTENKIDYNRFRAYELQAYYKELHWKTNFKDWFILGATKIVTGFDHSWQRALAFSLISALIFYSLFFISENYFYDFDIIGWKRYLSGYFRFLLVTDFYSPLENGRTYIHNSNTIGWFIFILGKIVIAFGIYEMIQAFRKFKA